MPAPGEAIADFVCPWFWPQMGCDDARALLRRVPPEPGLFLFFATKRGALAMAALDATLQPRVVRLDVHSEVAGAEPNDPVVLNAILQKLQQQQQQVAGLPPLCAYIAGTSSRPRRVGLPFL